MLKANENVERETVAECILLHPAILVKGSDSKLRRFDAAAVQKVFRELHHKRLGQYSTPNGGHRYERWKVTEQNESNAKNFCELYNVSFEKYKKHTNAE